MIYPALNTTISYPKFKKNLGKSKTVQTLYIQVKGKSMHTSVHYKQYSDLLYGLNMTK